MTGCSLGGADLNQDGLAELLVGSHGDALNTGYEFGGTLAIVYGRSSFAPSYDLQQLVPPLEDIAILQAEARGSNLAFDIATDDLNADGFPDLVVGAPALRCDGCVAPEPTGRVYLVLGGPDAGPAPSDRVLVGASRIDEVADVIWESQPSGPGSGGDWFGWAVASAGFSGATYSRINSPLLSIGVYGPVVLIGTGDNQAFALAYDPGRLVELPPLYDCEWDPDSNLVRCRGDGEDPESPRGWRIVVQNQISGGHRFLGGPDEELGYDVHGGDLDGDGLGDLVFGATGQRTFDDPAGDGRVYLFRGD